MAVGNARMSPWITFLACVLLPKPAPAHPAPLTPQCPQRGSTPHMKTLPLTLCDWLAQPTVIAGFLHNNRP